jgi:branched-chain amino acid transport system permease protein
MNLTEFLQTTVSGVSLGFNYALLAIGIVIVFAATRVLNFAQGVFVIAGAYMTYQLGAQAGLPFVLGVVISMVIAAVLAILTGQLLLKRFSHRASFAAVVVTIGLLFLAQALVGGLWGDDPKNLGDPWGLSTVTVGGVVLPVAKLWIVGIGIVVLGAVFCLLRFSRIGLSMRAAVSDEEAAVSVGIKPRSVSMFAWGVAGASGALAGTLLATGTGGVSTTLSTAALAALPAMVLGGIDSPLGALVGGLIVGLAQQYAAMLGPTVLSSLGTNFPDVLPYLLLTVALLVRPQGLFGTKSALRF